jgi:hypothetical protein
MLNPQRAIEHQLRVLQPQARGPRTPWHVRVSSCVAKASLFLLLRASSWQWPQSSVRGPGLAAVDPPLPLLHLRRSVAKSTTFLCKAGHQRRTGGWGDGRGRG